MRPRFSLRWLLILTALTAFACYGWFVRPTVLANQFVTAIDRRDIDSIDSMWRGAEIDLSRVEHLNAGNSAWRIRARPVPRTWGDIWRGVQLIRFELHNSALNQTRSGTLPFPTLIATPLGIYADPTHRQSGYAGMAL
jgi:hypothetical protein